MLVLIAFGSVVLLRFTEREPDFAAAIDVEHLDVNFVALVQDVLDAADSFVGNLANVEQAVSAGHYFDEGAELHDFADGTVIDLADFRLRVDGLDHLDLFFHRDPVGRRDQHRAVIFDIDFASGLLDQAADNFAARSDHFADLVGLDMQGDNSRRVGRNVFARGRERLVHYAEHEQTRVAGLM